MIGAGEIQQDIDTRNLTPNQDYTNQDAALTARDWSSHPSS